MTGLWCGRPAGVTQKNPTQHKTNPWGGTNLVAPLALERLVLLRQLRHVLLDALHLLLDRPLALRQEGHRVEHVVYGVLFWGVEAHKSYNIYTAMARTAQP